ncbi:hypothetical protein [Natrononativus amylolyticus]|uniref:hypothetical protein n=1 Tax=Natrononativus amylolyticus TaxID=2963434 RepID=UPI0020CCE2E0|nr:hypothetical protein [Natrononativus amylolyticus]
MARHTDRDIRPSGIFNRQTEPYFEAVYAEIDDVYERLDDLEESLDADKDPQIDSIIDGLGELEKHLDDLSDSLETVHVGHDLGCDLDEDVAEAIQAHYDGRPPESRCHRYIVPDSQLWNSRLEARDHVYLGIVGEGHSRIDVGEDVSLLARIEGERHELRDLTLDVVGESIDAGIARVSTTSYGLFENLAIEGQRNRIGLKGDRHTLRLDATKEDAVNVARGIRFPDGDTYHEDEEDAVGYAIPISAEPDHVGTNLWEACYLEGWFDNGYYVTNGPGVNILRACTAVNCAGAAFRLGHRDRLEQCRIVVEDHPGHAWTGLWINEGDRQIVDGLEIEVDAAKTNEVIRCHQDGPAIIRNVHLVDTGGGGRQLSVRAPTVLQDLEIEAETVADYDDYIAYLRGPDVVFERCRFIGADQGVATRHGMVVMDGCSRPTIRDCVIETDGTALRFDVPVERWRLVDTDLIGDVLIRETCELDVAAWHGVSHDGDVRVNGTVERTGGSTLGGELESNGE